jgi:hypothetical protein
MSTFAFRVSDWVWCTSLSELQCAGASVACDSTVPVLSLPAAERRRLNPLTSFALRAGERLVSSRPPELVRDTPLVFGSAEGDGAVLLRLLSALREHQPVSPTQFHNSVHNAPAGYWSIGLGSQAPSTAIAASENTMEVALVEAGLQAVTRCGPVLMMASSRQFPDELGRARPGLQDFAIAAWCEPGGPRTGWRCTVSSETAQDAADGEMLEAAVRARGHDGLVGSRFVQRLAAVLTITRESL